jgi:hypothetical protein
MLHTPDLLKVSAAPHMVILNQRLEQSAPAARHTANRRAYHLLQLHADSSEALPW